MAKARVRELAYFNWCDEGCPQGRDLEHWCAAERAWIEQEFVPDRKGEEIRTDCDDECAEASALPAAESQSVLLD
jgi:hypothetical protein